MERVHAFWCRIPSRPNVGDALTPWLIRRLTGRYPRFSNPGAPGTTHLVTGSVAACARERCVLWGPGIMSASDAISDAATLLAVRGPLTRARALDCGAACPDILGDPAMLMPRLYCPPATERRGMGLVPHFADRHRLATTGDWRLVDVQSPVERFIDQLTACAFAASSSLHGLILGHAYRIPSVWIKFRDLPSGDDTKFHDYFLALGLEPPEPVRVRHDDIDPGRLVDRAVCPELPTGIDRLWETCPFRGSL